MLTLKNREQAINPFQVI